MHVTARAELPATVALLDAAAATARSPQHGTTLTLAKELPVEREVPTAEAMRALGERLAGWLRAGDLRHPHR